MTLKSYETELIGNWINGGAGFVGDAVELRINKLIASDLEKVAVSPETGAWETLYRDPNDRRYWELTYPRSEMLGGGPKRLANISDSAARSKYHRSGNGA